MVHIKLNDLSHRQTEREKERKEKKKKKKEKKDRKIDIHFVQ